MCNNFQFALARFLICTAILVSAPLEHAFSTERIQLASSFGTPSSRLCLGLRNDNTLRGNPLVLTECGPNDSRSYPRAWQLVNNLISLRGASAMCIHKHNRGFENGNALHLWECAAGNAEMKEWRYDSETGYIRSNIDPNKCFHMKNREPVAGNPIHIWGCDVGREEMKRWRIVRARPWRFHTDDTSTQVRFRSSFSNYCLAGYRSSLDGSQPETNSCPSLRNIRNERSTDLYDKYYWQLHRVTGREEYFWFRNIESNLCLNVHRGRHNYEGAPASLYKCEATPDQYWEKINARDHFRLRNVSTGRCLNARSESDLSAPHMYDCDKNWRDMQWKNDQLFPPPPRPDDPPPPPRASSCSDNRDNDFDGLVDYPSDPGCESANDDTELNTTPLTRYSELAMTNCTTQRIQISFWRKDHTSGSDWERIDSLSHQYNSAGTCPTRSSEYVTIDFPVDNHVYEVRAIAPAASSCGGRDEPDYAACIRDSGVYIGDSSGAEGRSFVQ